MQKFDFVMLLVLLLGFVLPAPVSLLAQENAAPGVVCNLEGIGLYDTPDGNRMGSVRHMTNIQIFDNIVVSSSNSEWVEIQIMEGEMVGNRGWAYEGAVEKTPMIYSVLANTLNVRATPNTQADIIGELNRGTLVEFLGHETLMDMGGIWVYVRQIDTGLEGWVYSNYLEARRVARECTPILLDASPNTPLEAMVRITRASIRDEERHHFITVLPLGTRVRIVEQMTEWAEEYDIPYGDEQGHFDYYFRSPDADWSYIYMYDTDTYGWLQHTYALVILPATVRVAINQLAIYAEPSAQSSVLGNLHRGDTVEIVDSTNLNGEAWLFTGQGWIRGENVEYF